MNRTYDEILAAMRDRYRSLAGFEADDASDIGIRLKVLAEQVHALAQRAEALAGQVFPQTATGPYLDLHAETRGLARKGAVAARGVLRFGRETPAPTDIPIPAGTAAATRGTPQLRFETEAAGVLTAGATHVDLPCRALEPGAEGNAAAGAVCVPVTAVAGISTAVNPAACAGGVDAEDDAALRRRLLESFRSISNGTNAAFYHDLAMSREGVASAAVLPRHRGRGTVDVVAAAADPSVLAELQDACTARKEINVDVLVRAARPLATDVSVELEAVPGHDWAAVRARAEEALEACFGALGVGKPLYTAQLTAALQSLDGVANCRVGAPGADVRAQRDEIIVAGDIAVTGM